MVQGYTVSMSHTLPVSACGPHARSAQRKTFGCAQTARLPGSNKLSETADVSLNAYTKALYAAERHICR